MINKQNKHGPRSDLMQGDDTIRGFFPSYPACYPIKFIIKPPGNRRTTLNKWSWIDIACGLPALSHSGCPDTLTPLLTHKPAGTTTVATPGETMNIRCKGTAMRGVLSAISRQLSASHPTNKKDQGTTNNEHGTWNMEQQTENRKPNTENNKERRIEADG